jgi:hypothetical protein
MLLKVSTSRKIPSQMSRFDSRHMRLLWLRSLDTMLREDPRQGDSTQPGACDHWRNGNARFLSCQGYRVPILTWHWDRPCPQSACRSDAA